MWPEQLTVLEAVDVLETIAEFRSASLELIAWEFDVPTSECERPWRKAIERGLLQPDGPCPQSGEAMYGLTAHGESRLRELREHSCGCTFVLWPRARATLRIVFHVEAGSNHCSV